MQEQVRILIVDDDPHLLSSSLRLLKRAGYDVLEAETGAAGLRLARERKPHLILLDVALPDINGFEMCRRIKADRALANTFVVLVSGTHVESGEQAQGLELGADDYITRPISNREFLARVETMVRLRRAEVALRQRTHELEERVKELNCLHGISALVETPGITLVGILKETVDLIPPAWQHPEITVVRLVFEDLEFLSPGFQESPWCQACDIVVNGERLGRLQVCYLKERPEKDEGPFLREERDLIEAVAGRLGKIIERFRIQAVLKESEGKYRELVENINEVIFSLDMEGVLTFVSPAVELLLERSPAQVVGHHFREFIYSEDLASVDEAFQAILSGQRAGNEYRVMTKSGKVRWMRTSSRPVVREGRVTGVQGTLADITERRKAQDLAHRLSEVVEQSSSMVIITDLEGNIEYVNRRFTEITGYSLQDAIGQNPRLLKSGRHSEDHYRELWDTVLAGQRWRGEFINTKKSGELYYEQASVSPITNAQGEVTHLVKIAEDFTERRQIEAALRESEALLAKSQAIAHVGSWELDLVANRLTWSDEVYHIFGLCPQEFGATYEAFLDAVHPDDREAVDAAYAESLHERRDGYEIEHRIVRRDSGEVRVVQERCEHIKDASGRIVRSVGMVQDITERKQMEDALRESEAMFRAQYEGMPIPTYTWQKHGDDAVLIDHNRAAMAATQGAIRDFMGSRASEMYRDRPDIVEDLSRCLTEKCSLEREMTYRFMTTSEVRHFLVRYAYVHPDLVLVHTEDFTERKQAETERERLLAALDRRSAQLQTAAEVSRAASSILNPDRLIQQAVDLAREQFDLYYAGLFLVDQSGEWTGEPDKWAVLRAGTGEAGRQMVKQGHKLEIGSTSMIGWCVANKQARAALDVGADPPVARFENLLLPETRSELALPLISRGEAIGALTIQSAEEAAFSDEDIVALQTMADQLANAIENARLYEEAKGYGEKLATLYQISRDITSLLELDALLQLIGEHSTRLTGADKSLILLVDMELQTLAKVVGVGFAPGQIEGITYQEVQDGISGWVLRERIPTISRDILTDPRNTGLALQMAKKERVKSKSMVVAPLLVKGKVIGTLSVMHNVEKPIFGQDDLDLVVMLASQAAIAIENAQLYEQAQQEIDERERAAEALRAALDEKTVLLQEIHHRVKNNLQIISSLLDMQSMYLQEPMALQAIQDSRSRIRSMALVHERLYQSGDLASIDVHEYLKSLTNYLLAMYERNAPAIRLTLQADDVYLDLDTAIASGLIVNELVSNALKHAFPPGWEGEGELGVELGALDDGWFLLIVSDNGVGLSSELDLNSVDSLGLRLVSMLTQQLRGTLEVDSSAGTIVKITFPGAA